MSRLRSGIWIAFAALAAAQLVPVDRSNPPVTQEVAAPANVRSVLRRACYDCHSNETDWPWYSYVAPVSWFVARHVHNGRKDLNFTEWPILDFEAQENDLKDIREEVADGDMPLRSYTIVHLDARLTDADRELLLEWAGGREPTTDD